MALRKEIEKSLTREDNDVDAVEDQGMKDSVLAIASIDFKEDDVLALPLTSCKRNKIDIGADYPGKAVSREQYGRDVDLAESDSESEVVGHSLNDDLMGLEESESEDDEDVDSEEEDESEEEEESVHDDDDDVKHVSLQSRSRLDNEKDDASPLEVFHSSATATEEVKRGNAVREQLRMWESLLECRIKLEPALVAANRLYQMGKMADFIKENKSSNGPDFDAVKNSLQVLSSSLLDLQLRLGKQSGMEESHNREEAEEDDESIHSSEASDVERTDDVNPNDNKLSDDESDGVPPSKKKKISSDKSCDQLYSEFSNYRNAEINRWNEKAKVSGGRAAQKDFSAFDESIINIIESILFDKHRLVRKTQQNRSDCVVYGKTTTAAKPENDSNIEENGEDGAIVSEGISQGKKHLYDAEIFDDGDFYQKLLRDFIETKSSDGGLSQQERKLMELHRLRIKMKRKLDTRATKGRKLRFVVHPKLVSFMAPVPSNSFSTEAEEQLLKSLFGQTITRTV